MTDSRISVVMTSYGKSRYIESAIESVLTQTFVDFELIVVDDCSVDGSKEIAQEYSEADRRVKVITNPARLGFSRATNVGIRNASGEAVAFIDADDVYSPEYLQRVWGRMKGESMPTVVYTDRWRMDQGGIVIPRTRPSHDYQSGSIFGDLLARGFGHITAALIPKVCFQRVGLYDESLTWAVDYDFALRLAREYPFAFVPERLYGYRVYKGTMSNSIDRMARLKVQSTIVEKYLRGSSGLLTKEQREGAERELLRMYWVSGQHGRAVFRGLRSRAGVGFLVRYSGRSLFKEIRGGK